MNRNTEKDDAEIIASPVDMTTPIAVIVSIIIAIIVIPLLK